MTVKSQQGRLFCWNISSNWLVLLRKFWFATFTYCLNCHKYQNNKACTIKLYTEFTTCHITLEHKLCTSHFDIDLPTPLQPSTPFEEALLCLISNVYSNLLYPSSLLIPLLLLLTKAIPFEIFWIDKCQNWKIISVITFDYFCVFESNCLFMVLSFMETEQGQSARNIMVSIVVQVKESTGVTHL